MSHRSVGCAVAARLVAFAFASFLIGCGTTPLLVSQPLEDGGLSDGAAFDGGNSDGGTLDGGGDGATLDGSSDGSVDGDSAMSDGGDDGSIDGGLADGSLDGGLGDGATSDAGTDGGSPTLVGIDLTPTNPTLGVGVTQAFVATGRFSDGSIADVTTMAMWSSSAPSTFLVNGGVVTTATSGSGVLSATVGSIVGTTNVTVTAAALVSISVTPASADLAIGGTTSLTATGVYADGTSVDLTDTVLWTSSATNVASVSNASSSAGLVTGSAGGTATITASYSGVTGTATVDVTPATLKSIAISPANPTTPKGTTVSFTAKGTYSDGTVVDVTTQVTWSTSDVTVATVANGLGKAGTATAVAPGSTVVTASLGTTSATTTLTVTAAALVSLTVTPSSSSLVVGLTTGLTATGHYSDGSSVDVTTGVVWSTANAAVATVSNATGSQGRVTATGTGTASVTATLGMITGTASVTVAAPTLQQIVVSPMALSRPVGDPVRYTAMAVYSNFTQQNVTTFATWRSTNTSVATTNGATAHPVAPGVTTISATFQGLTGSTTLTVTSATLVRIDVAPVASTIAAGSTLAFQATAVFSDGTAQNVTRQVTWLSSAPTVATVVTGTANAGIATTIAPGTTNVQATVAGVTGSTTLTVTNATVVAIDVAPAIFSAAVGTTHKFTAQAIYSDGTSRDVTTQATWVSSAPSVVAVDDGAAATRGSAVALAAGSAAISATYGGVTGSATFTVTNATLTTIQVTPFLVNLPIGFTIALQATGLYSDNTTLDLTKLATWSSSAAGVAAVSDAGATRGNVTAVTAGMATISATYGGVTGTVPVTVTSATLGSIQIMPSMPMVARLGTLALDAIGTFTDGTTLDVTAFVTWLSSSTGVANVSNASGSRGVATGLASGSTTVSAVRGSVTGTTTLTVP